MLWCWKNSWSSYGTPSSRDITSDGTGSANARTRSAGGPASIISSRKPSTNSWICGRMACARRKVKSLVIIRRSRLCSGSSIRAKICGTLSSALFACIDSGIVFALRRGSVKAALMSSYRLITQFGLPRHNANCRPSDDRHSSNSGGGCKGQRRSRGTGTAGSAVVSPSAELVAIAVPHSSLGGRNRQPAATSS